MQLVVPDVLESVVVIKDYRKGLTEYAVRKCRSHRRISESLLNELDGWYGLVNSMNSFLYYMGHIV